MDTTLERGDLAGLVAELDIVAACAREVRGPFARFTLLRGQATLPQAQARFADARRLVVEATTLGHPEGFFMRAAILGLIGRHVGFGGEGYHGPVALGLGSAARFLRRFDDAVADLGQAVDACAANGAVGFRVEAQLELAEAELVAQGLTNREIAARLQLSERTAQNHVQHILTKLDLPNRGQIALWVARRA